MNVVLHNFTGSFCITSMSILNPADALTNIELVVEYEILFIIKLKQPSFSSVQPILKTDNYCL